MAGKRLKVMLRWIQILDKLEPFYKEKGEFRFTARVSSDNGVVQETRFPEEGHYEISDHPAWNKLTMNLEIFDGEVGDNLVVELNGEEIDLLSANDQLAAYRREFAGEAGSWLGWYGPGDEAAEPPEAVSADPENLTNWRVCYEILDA
ncbi:MAG: hypothetical protein ABFS34_10675 [Gemmatimonadota bacterium]